MDRWPISAKMLPFSFFLHCIASDRSDGTDTRMCGIWRIENRVCVCVCCGGKGVAAVSVMVVVVVVVWL